MPKTVVVNSDDDTSYDCLFGDDWRVLHESSSDSVWINWPQVDLVLLVGAYSDVDPQLYQQAPSAQCGTVDRLQDLEALRFIDTAMVYGVPVVGICKGAQQLCVKNRGSLIQDVPRVAGHEVCRKSGNGVTYVAADHHQVMQPSFEGEVRYLNREHDYPEIVVYPYRQLAVQFHPEWCIGEPGHELFNEIVEEVCQVEL